MTYLKLYEADSPLPAFVEPAEEPRIDAAVTLWIREGRDTLLDLTLLEGDEYRILASRITSWIVSTPEGRKTATELEALYAEEERMNRRACGLWDDE